MELKLRTFDDTTELFEKDGDKLEKREQAKLEKLNQLQSRQNTLKIKIRKKEMELNKSVVDPHMDTIQIAMDVELMKKEKTIVDKVIAQIFPEEVETKK
jgi:hypothetical protein